MASSESCAPIYIVQNLGGIKKDSDKVTYIKDTLERCSIAPTPTKRKKRPMSGYNCFIRVSVKKGEPFKKVVKAKTWSTFSDKQKSTWNHLAKEGCPPRLWGR